VWDTTEEKLLHCGIKQKKSFLKHPEIVLHFHNEGKPLPLCPTTEEISSIVGYNRGKPPLLYTTMQEMLLHCMPQRQKKFLS
jgi:hypothetical protein